MTDRRTEGRSFCEASVFNKERIRHGLSLLVPVCPPVCLSACATVFVQTGVRVAELWSQLLVSLTREITQREQQVVFVS